jgi:hypothetical protein
LLSAAGRQVQSSEGSFSQRESPRNIREIRAACHAGSISSCTLMDLAVAGEPHSFICNLRAEIVFVKQKPSLSI